MSKKATVVIVEDNESMIFLFTDLLESANLYDVVAIAKDGQEAIQLVRHHKPDILIMDICLPGIDGIGVLEELNLARDVYFPKVVITSCMGLDEITKNAMNLGAAYYFVKPFDSKSFLSRLEQLVDRPLGEALQKSLPVAEARFDENSFRKHLQSKIGATLHLLGVPPHTKGYVYLKEAIELVYYDASLMKITKYLYPKLAENHQTTTSSVERAIRNTIDLTLERGDLRLLDKFFGHVRAKPDKMTNSEFIAATVEYLKSDH